MCQHRQRRAWFKRAKAIVDPGWVNHRGGNRDFATTSREAPFASPLYRKSFLMKPTVNAELELQDTKPCVYQVNDVRLKAWTRNVEKRDDGHPYLRSPKAPSGFRV